ncbi:MAG: hypothetical protein ACOYM3_32885 [Terrimicrobiaceae bacterium]
MKPIPTPFKGVRQAIHIISVAGHSGRKILRLTLPIISVVFTAIQEFKKR